MFFRAEKNKYVLESHSSPWQKVKKVPVFEYELHERERSRGKELKENMTELWLANCPVSNITPARDLYSNTRYLYSRTN